MYRNFTFSLLIIFILFNINLSVYAESNNDLRVLSNEALLDTVFLHSGWKFVPDDNIKYSSGISSDIEWFRYSGASPWQYEISEVADYHDFAWYSLNFNLAEDVMKTDLGLKIQHSYSSFQLYLNGELIYQSRDWNSNSSLSSGEMPPLILLSHKNLNYEEANTISIRAGSHSGWGGAGVIYIGYFHQINNLIHHTNIKIIAIGFTALFIFIYFLLQFLLRRKELSSLYISLSGLSVSLFILGYCGHLLSIFNEPWAYWIFTFIGGINMYLMPILFIHSFFGIKKGLVAKMFIIVYCFFSLFVVFEYLFTFQIFYFVKYLYNFFNLTYLLVVPYLIYINIVAIKKKMAFAKIMLIGIILLSISFLISTLTFAAILISEPPIGEGFFAMVVAFSFVLAKRSAKTHSDLELAHGDLVAASNEIKELNESLEIKVESRTKELKEKNKQITDSLEYAGQIQHSVLPTDDQMHALFEDCFVLWQPRGIVGGDLYWLHQHDEGFLLAVIDCTGHGVPGALLTMSVSSTLDHIVDQMGIREPDEVLFYLNNILKDKLNQGDTDPYADDGLEISIISFVNGIDTLEYSGSRLRLFTLEGEKVAEYKGNRQTVGFKRSKKDQKFDLHRIKIRKNTRFFLTTDGYVEQSGGIKGYSLGWERFKSFLLSGGNNMSDMKTHLEKQFEKFRSIHDLRDDVLVIGFEIDVN